MHSAHAEGERYLVFMKLGQHALCSYEVPIVVRNSLEPRNVADGAVRGSANLPGALGCFVGYREYLVSVVIEKQMIIAKVRSAHMPMKILRFQIEAEHICEQRIQRPRDVFNCLQVKVGRGGQRSLLALHKFSSRWHFFDSPSCSQMSGIIRRFQE